MRINYFLFIAGVLGFGTALSAEPTNLDVSKKQVIRYHDSGQYDRDLSATIAKAKSNLTQLLKYSHPQKLAIVLDIDETSLSNYSWERRLSFGGDYMKKWKKRSIKPMLPPLNQH